MSAAQHSPEPWQTSHRMGLLHSANQCPVADPMGLNPEERKANARRIAACVNACAGVDDALLHLGTLRAAFTTMDQAQTQRDELAEALRKISDEAEAGLHTIDSDGIQAGRAALAKLSGERE